MPIQNINRNVFRRAIFFLTVILIIAFTLGILTTELWPVFEKSGKALLTGKLPVIPTYPIWGYSLTIGLCGRAAVILQVAAAVFIFFCLCKLIIINNLSLKICRLNLNSEKLLYLSVIFLFPWLVMAGSLTDNSAVSLIVTIGVIVLFDAFRSNRRLSKWNIVLYSLVMGAIFGLAFNFRAEVLLFFILIILALIIYAVFNHSESSKTSFLKIGTAIFAFVIFLLPWLIYTKHHTGKFLLNSTNSSAVAYMGWGVLPNNPWGIKPHDNYVQDMANDSLQADAWSYAGYEFYRKKFAASVKSQPHLFLLRMLQGWKLLIFNGLYSPTYQHLFNSQKDKYIYDYVSEWMKQKLGYTPDDYALIKYHKWGISQEDVTPLHLIIFLFEVILRIIGILIWISLILISFYHFIRCKFNLFNLINFAALAWIFIIAGCFQTSPRHTTQVLPIIIYTALWQIRTVNNKLHLDN